jgi:ATPase subunit of ABC transporter with duplicated ATPase domains
VLLLISHDRALLDDVCDKFVILDGLGNARVFEGTYRDWEAKQKAESSEAAARAKRADAKPASKPTQTSVQRAGEPKPQQTATVAHASQARSAEPARPQKQPGGKSRNRYSNLALDKIEARISEIGRELMEIDFEFADPKTASDAAKTKKLLARREDLAREQSELEEEWMRKSG